MHVSCYAAATTGVFPKYINSLPKQTVNSIGDVESELKTKLRGVEELKVGF